jgi:hypothetical protein
MFPCIVARVERASPVDKELRTLLEIARADGEYALQELRRYGVARLDVAEDHVANVVASLDGILSKADKQVAKTPPHMKH